MRVTGFSKLLYFDDIMKNCAFCIRNDKGYSVFLLPYRHFAIPKAMVKDQIVRLLSKLFEQNTNEYKHMPSI